MCISKCLVNLLIPLLDVIVAPDQSAFVPGRLIIDNAFIAFECMHTIKQERNQENSFCAYKLDLSKAYDRVDWGFLERVMVRLGFAHRWVQWIMTCVTTVRYTVKFNGTLLERSHRSEASGKVIPYRHFYSYLWLMGYLSCSNRE